MLQKVLSLVGRAVDRYDVLEQLGQGGFGAVFLARHRVVGNDVALKVLWPDRADDPTVVKRFLQEARAAAALGSDHIVRVSDAGTTDDGLVFLAMERLRGRDLASELKARGGTLPVGAAITVVDQILEALRAAHGKGIIHRDLKPGNVFLAEEEGARVAKLLDFGIAKVRGAPTLTAGNMVLGTPQYMAPEQLAGTRLDHRADVFAVGAILYELLCGRVPIEGSSYEVIVKRVQGLKPPDIRKLRGDLPDALADVVMRALAVDPDARWPDAAAMQVALRDAAGGRVAPLGGAPTVPPARRSGRPDRPTPSAVSAAETILAPVRSARPWQLGGLAVLAVLLAAAVGTLGVLGVRFVSRDDAPPVEPVTVPPLPPPVAPAPPPPSVVVEPAVNDPVPTDPAPLPPVTPTPVSTGPIRWEIVQFHGNGPRAEVNRLIERSRDDVRACATDRPLHLVIQLHVNAIAISGFHHPSRRSDDRHVAACVADAIARGSVEFGHLQSAIVDVELDLPAR